MGGWLKFTGDNWDAYIHWPNVIDAIINCTAIPNSASRFDVTAHSDNMCWDKLNCALAAADPSQQAQYSSTATILGLLPTVLSVMATSTNDLLLIHHRYPLLALLLALCNPSTILSDLSLLNRPKRILHKKLLLPSTRSEGYHIMLSRVHSTLHPFFSFGVPAPVDTTRKHVLLSYTHDIALHLLVAGLAVVVIWQSVLLGMRGVFVYACWTWHEPFTWIGVGGLAHVLSFMCFRLCLSRLHPQIDPWYTKLSWSLSRSGGRLHLRHPRMAQFFDLLFQVIGLMNYGYGTVMLSGINLVSPQSGLRVFCLMGFAAVASRLVTIWLLEIWPEVPVEGLDDRLDERIGIGLDDMRLGTVGKGDPSGVNESQVELLSR